VESQILAFCGVAALVTISPGADFALVTRRALVAPPREALVTAAGICTGVLAWGALSAVGVAAVIAASDTAYDVLRAAGAAYLVVLGLRALRESSRVLRGAGEDLAVAPVRGGAFRTGLATNLLNPKVAVFYAAVLPQFVAPGDPVLAVSLLLAALHAVMGLAWYGACVWLLARAAGWFRRPRVRAALEATTGAVLVGLGVRVALSAR
jgi:threonine/homoserine/homoserine lactone efflux protein